MKWHLIQISHHIIHMKVMSRDILNNVNSELLILKGLNTVDTDLYNQYSKAFK